MKKIIITGAILSLIIFMAVAYLNCMHLFSVKIDTLDSDIYLCKGLNKEDIINFHSYLQDPPALRRASKYRVITFEVPKEKLAIVLKNMENKDTTLLDSMPEYVKNDIIKKLTRIKKYLEIKKEAYDIPSFSKDAKVFRAVTWTGGDFSISCTVMDKSSNGKFLMIYSVNDSY